MVFFFFWFLKHTVTSFSVRAKKKTKKSIGAQVEIPAFHNGLTAVNETSARDSENYLVFIWRLCAT